MAMIPVEGRSWVLCGVLAVLVSGSAGSLVARAQDDTSVGTEARIDAEADRQIRRMSDYLAAAKGFSFHADVVFDDVLQWGQKVQYGATMDVTVRRPDRLAGVYDGDLGSRRFWYDGQTATVFDPVTNAFAVTSVPPTIPEALDYLMANYDLSMPLADVTYPDFYKATMGEVEHGFYLGLHGVAGPPCHHLAFVQEAIDWQVWIQDGREPLLRKVVITYKSLPGAPQYAATLSGWTFRPYLRDRLFTAHVPADAERLDFLPCIREQSPEKEGTRQ
jgi:hypothetical protein